ncbi:MAG: DUF1905 domain-containing protein [Patescibacteria group bacterium]
MLETPIYRFEGKVWPYPGEGSWHFITIPEQLSQEIKEMFGYLSVGWGTLPVTATIGNTSWNTSIFRDKKTNSYLLPVKAEVRKKEKINIENVIEVILQVRV